MNTDEITIKLNGMEIYYIMQVIEESIEHGVHLESARELIRVFDKLNEV